MRKMKEITAVILASIMTISSIPQYTATAEENGKSNTTAMEVGETYEVVMHEGDALCYMFTPEKDGEYVFTSEGDYDVYASLLDSQENKVAENDDGGEECNFQLSANLTSGEVYILRLGSYEDEAEFYISVMRESLSVTYDADVTVLYGEDAELVVNAESEEGETITYQWYRYDYENDEYIEIDSATDAVYKLKYDNVSNSYEEYICVVTAGKTEKTAYFSVKIDSGLRLDYQKYQYGLEGDSITLEVQAQSRTEILTYSWYENDELINEVNGNSCTITLSEQKKYSCKVSDGIKMEQAVFDVEIGQAGEKRVESILSVEPTRFCFYDVDGGDRSYSSAVKVRYEDGTEGYSSGVKYWDTIVEDEYGDWIAGKYKGYLYCKGAITSFDYYVIRNSEIIELQSETEVVAQIDYNDTYEWNCYKISVPVEGDYCIQLSATEGSGQVFYGEEASWWHCEKYSFSKDQTFQVRNGANYYLWVYSTEKMSYQIKLTTDYWKTIHLGDVLTLENDYNFRYQYYKYVPTKNGIYNLKWIEEYDCTGEYVEIYDKDMKLLVNQYNITDMEQFYLKQGEVYYIKFNIYPISVSEQIDRKIKLENVEYMDYPASVVAAGRYDCLSWNLNNDGILSIQSEDGSMPEAPWSCLNDEVKVLELGENMEEIASSAFYGCDNLQEIQFPQTIKKVGNFAFYECQLLSKIKLSENLIEIGSDAFWGCVKLEKLEIPSNVTVIGEEAFEYCENLREVILPDENSLKLVEENAFSNTEWAKQQGNPIMLGDIMLKYQVAESNVVIPQTVSYIGGAALKNAQFDKVSFSDNLKGIWNYGLSRCTNLKQVTIPGSVTEVAYCAFEACTALENVVLEDGVQSLGKAAFLQCSSLKTITIPSSVITIENNAIGYEWDLEHYLELKKTETLPTIYCYADSAAYTYAIENEIPYVLLDEGSDTTKPSDNPSQSEKPSDNTGSTGGEKPSDTTNMPQTEKPSDSSPEQIIIPDTIKTVQSGACVYEITSTDTVTLTGLKKSKTKKLTIPKTITVNGTKYKVAAIADNAFKNAKITSFTIGSNVKTIGTSAFENCKSLTKVTLAGGVTKINKNAFKNCKKLKNITIKSTKLKAIGKNAFKGIKSTAKIKVPKKKMNAYKKMLKRAGIGNKVSVTK